MKDVHGLLGPVDSYYKPFDLKPEQWLELHRRTSGDTSILSRISEVNPGPTFAVAQKKYAALNYGGPFADTIVCLGSALADGPFQGLHRPDGVNVPEYITLPKGNRFYIGATNDWGSGQEVYPFHGDSFVTGTDSSRLGGDVWVGDVVEQVIDHEPGWSAILASFGSIDKVSDVLAEHDGPTEKTWAVANGISLADATQKADVELGRILDRLEETGLDKETVVVITADHGGQHSRHFHGSLAPGAHEDNLWYGLGHTTQVPKGIQPLVDTGRLEIASMNTIVSCWTRPMTAEQKQDFSERLSRSPGVAEVYEKEEVSGQSLYVRRFRSPKLHGPELVWAQAHHADLVDTLASSTGPNFIALLFDGHGYDVPGSHGGAQELVQRIPYIVLAPNLKQPGSVSTEWVRLVDVNPIVGEILGLNPDSRLDGTSDPVRSYLTPRPPTATRQAP